MVLGQAGELPVKDILVGRSAREDGEADRRRKAEGRDSGVDGDRGAYEGWTDAGHRTGELSGGSIEDQAVIQPDAVVASHGGREEQCTTAINDLQCLRPI